MSLDSGDIDGVVVLLVREGGAQERGERNTKEKERERGKHLSCTRDFQFITTDLPRQFDAAPTLDERRHMSIAAAENAGIDRLIEIARST